MLYIYNLLFYTENNKCDYLVVSSFFFNDNILGMHIKHTTSGDGGWNIKTNKTRHKHSIKITCTELYLVLCRYLCDIFLKRARENNRRYNLVQPKNVEASFCDLVASSGENVNSEQNKTPFPSTEGFPPCCHIRAVTLHLSRFTNVGTTNDSSSNATSSFLWLSLIRLYQQPPFSCGLFRSGPNLYEDVRAYFRTRVIVTLTLPPIGKSHRQILEFFLHIY